MVGEVIAGRYELQDVVGSGGMSSVYRAYDRLLDRTVALKILHEQYGRDDEYVERFRREARAVAQLTHPNIVTVIDRGEDAGRQYIVFEYIEGENLKETVTRSGPLPAHRAVELALQTARALAFAHERGLIHRDVKPQNVLLGEDGLAKVTDFGIARALDVEGVTQPGTVLGTSDYIAPEQARGQRVDAHTDVYSLGVVLYELLTGDVPFAGDNFVAVALRHINEPPPSILERRRDVPVRLGAAVERALAKDPADRFASMAEFVAELEACLAEIRSPERPTEIVRSPVLRESRRRHERARRRRRIPIAFLLALAVVAAVGVGAVVLLGDGGGEPASAKPGRVTLRAVAAYDPEGTGGEHDDEVQNATDGNPATYWPTETYQSFTKSGVGIVLERGGDGEPERLTVSTSTPGLVAEIREGDGAEGPFAPVAASQRIDDSRSYALESGSKKYLLLWITELPEGGVARITEVRAS